MHVHIYKYSYTIQYTLPSVNQAEEMRTMNMAIYYYTSKKTHDAQILYVHIHIFMYTLRLHKLWKH